MPVRTAQQLREQASAAFNAAIEARAHDLANDPRLLEQVAERLFAEPVPFDQIAKRCREKIADCIARRHHWSYSASRHLAHMTAIELRRAVEIVAERDTLHVVEIIQDQFSPAEQKRYAKMDAAADRDLAAYLRRCKRVRRAG